VEGERFAPTGAGEARAVEEITRRGAQRPALEDDRTKESPRRRLTNASRATGLGAIALAAGIVAAAFGPWPLSAMFRRPPGAAAGVQAATIAVGPTQSIVAALERAGAGSVVLVEPGEYRETLNLKNDVRIVSRVPRAATIRLSSTASEGAAAVVAAGVAGAELAGLRVIGGGGSPGTH